MEHKHRVALLSNARHGQRPLPPGKPLIHLDLNSLCEVPSRGGPRPGAAGATAPGVGPKHRGATVYHHKQYMLQCIVMDQACFGPSLARFLVLPLVPSLFISDSLHHNIICTHPFSFSAVCTSTPCPHYIVSTSYL
jgi:hypothetical protein